MKLLNVLVLSLSIVLIYMLSAYPVFADDYWPDETVVFEDPPALEDANDFDDHSLSEDIAQEDVNSEAVGVANTSSDEIIDKINSQGQTLKVLNDSVSTLNSKVDLLVAENETESNSGENVSEGGTASGSESDQAPEATATDIYNAVVFAVQSFWLLTGFVTAFLLCRFFLI